METKRGRPLLTPARLAARIAIVAGVLREHGPLGIRHIAWRSRENDKRLTPMAVWVALQDGQFEKVDARDRMSKWRIVA